jgi:hypothetical protein
MNDASHKLVKARAEAALSNLMPDDREAVDAYIEDRVKAYGRATGVWVSFASALGLTLPFAAMLGLLGALLTFMVGSIWSDGHEQADARVVAELNGYKDALATERAKLADAEARTDEAKAREAACVTKLLGVPEKEESK